MRHPEMLTTRLVDVGHGRLELDTAALRVSGGPDKGTEVELGPQPLRIGSSPDCELVLHDATVSALHAEVRLGGGGFVLRDLDSKNGVQLGQWRVERLVLGHGMRLLLGESTLRVVALGGRRQLELAPAADVGELVARSPAMRAMLAELRRYAASELTLLIEGETGAGKELVARTVHELSPRAVGPLTVVDCGALPPSLIAAELFGHEAGAFTGADRRRPGRFEQAEGGTLFLDEVGELPLDVQPVLLRALERRTSRSVGGKRERAHDVRIVAATNRNLREQVRQGSFREDLYFRLAGGVLRVPPLRERRDDILPLAEQLAADEGIGMPAELTPLLLAYPWPGNVRELRHAIARAALMPAAVGEELRASIARPGPAAACPLGDAGFEPLQQAREQARDTFEREYLARVIARSGDNLTAAARLAGVSRSYLMRLAAKHKMRLRDRSG